MTCTLILRADAGHRLGSGHVMRLAALAEAAGQRSLLIVGGEPAATVAQLIGRGLDAVASHGDSGTESDLAHVLGCAHDRGAAGVVVDGPGFSAGYVTALADRGLVVASLDDLGAAPLPTAIVVNHNLGAETLADRYPTTSTRLLGRRFHLLRGEFRRLSAAGSPPRPDARRVLITMGGSDPVGATARVVGALRGAHLELMVVLGPGFRHDAAFDRALAIADAHGHDVALAAQPADLPRLMSGCDVAISAAGGTLAELGYLGRPTFAVAIADDQIANARRHAAAELAVGGQPLADLTDEHLADSIAGLLGDLPLRRRLRDRAAAALDGRGADRVVAQLVAS